MWFFFFRSGLADEVVFADGKETSRVIKEIWQSLQNILCRGDALAQPEIIVLLIVLLSNLVCGDHVHSHPPLTNLQLKPARQIREQGFYLITGRAVGDNPWRVIISPQLLFWGLLALQWGRRDSVGH